MSGVAEIKVAIAHLSVQEVIKLRQWFDEWEANFWDQEIEADIQAGRLDKLADEALRAFEAGDYTERCVRTGVEASLKYRITEPFKMAQ